MAVLYASAERREVQVPTNLTVKELGINRSKSPVDHLSDKQEMLILLVLIAGFILFNSLLDTVDLQNAGQLVGP